MFIAHCAIVLNGKMSLVLIILLFILNIIWTVKIDHFHPASNNPNVFTINLTNTYSYQQVKGLNFSAHPEKSWVSVSCKIPNDCHVALTSVAAQYTPNKMYEIVIGGWGNRRSVIRFAVVYGQRETAAFGHQTQVRGQTPSNQHKTLKEKQGHEFSVVDTPNILQAKSFKPFWISWKAGNIQVGKGDVVGEHIFMVFDDPNPSSIAAISVSAWDAAGTVKITY